MAMNSDAVNQSSGLRHRQSHCSRTAWHATVHSLHQRMRTWNIIVLQQ
ncbi:hypothetical protein J2T20_003769 [Paenibacillus wynnii]|nr:hypothetical protein [Paenibacillus wynnii]